jgi:hypothetical protein
MPWANLDDQFPKHPKVLPLSDAAFRLHVAGICYCAQYETNGIVAAEMVPLLVPRYRARTLDDLVGRRLWMPHPEGYEIHDYLEWNRSKEQIEAERERKRKAGRKGAETRWGG